MSNNAIDALFEERNIVVREFALNNGISEQTLYKIRKKPTIKNISIDVFLKIAHGLGMTAEELYYGRPLERAYSDPRQGRINEQYEDMNELGKDKVASDVDDTHALPKYRKSAEVAELDANRAERRSA